MTWVNSLISNIGWGMETGVVQERMWALGGSPIPSHRKIALDVMSRHHEGQNLSRAPNFLAMTADELLDHCQG